jgi:hypothetical protein
VQEQNGSIYGASSLSISGINDLGVLEVLACHEALVLAEDLNLQRLTIAKDCLSVVNNMKQAYVGPYSMVIQEVKERARCPVVPSLDMKIELQI